MGLSLAQSFSFASTALVPFHTVDQPPPGFVFLTDPDGSILIDQDGAYMMEIE